MVSMNCHLSRVFKRIFRPHQCKRWLYSKVEGDNRVHSYEQILPLKLKGNQSGKDWIPVDLNVRTVERLDRKLTDPVLVCIHGFPGDGGHFHELSCELAKHGVRCISPDFPGCGKSCLHPNDVYSIDYSPAGKEDMLNRILDSLDIQRVDVLLSHSAGTFLGFRATAVLDRIKSGAFICFLGGKPHRYARPFNLLLLAADLIKKPMLQPMFLWLLPKVYTIIGFTENEVQSLQVAVENVSTAEFRKILDHAASIKEQKKPALFAFATYDKILELDVPYMILSHIGIKKSSIIHLCRENEPKMNMDLQGIQGEQRWYYRAMQFDRGGHLLIKTQVPELTKQILQLIEQVPSS